MDAISNCLIFLLSEPEHIIKKDDVYVSLAYNFPLENNNVWKWSDVIKEKGLGLDELLSGSTTFSRLLQSDKPYLFFNSKKEALEKNSYIKDDSDEIDENGYLKGSITCHKIFIKYDGVTYIRAILNICTYNKRFSKVDHITAIENIEYNMNNSIVNDFEKRIRVELCNYYMQYLYQQQNPSQQKTANSP